MENIFVEFLPPWVETGLQPAFYDKESGTVLQQTARMYSRVNMLIRMFNKLSKNTKTTVEDYINQFNELHDYVHDYFDNLDVREEINNKLDEMYANGQLDLLFSKYVNDYVEATNTRLNAIEDEVQSLNDLTPTVVSSTSAMTDHDKIYLNTSDGYWYYYNGSTFVQGGLYNSDATDTAIKWWIDHVASDYNNMLDPTTCAKGSLNTGDGAFNGGGNTYWVTDYIPIDLTKTPIASDYWNLCSILQDNELVSMYKVLFYDSDKVKAGAITSQLPYIQLKYSTHPEIDNFAYFRVQFKTDTISWDDRYKVRLAENGSAGELNISRFTAVDNLGIKAGAIEATRLTNNQYLNTKYTMFKNSIMPFEISDFGYGSITTADGTQNYSATRLNTAQIMRIPAGTSIVLSNGWTMLAFTYSDAGAYGGRFYNNWGDSIYFPIDVNVRFAFQNATLGDVNTLDSVKNLISNISVSKTAGTFAYEGEKVVLKPSYGASNTGLVNNGQDSACYGDNYITFNSNGYYKMYTMNGDLLKASTALDQVATIAPHANSVCFGTERYDSGDTYPLLYVNAYNNTSLPTGACYVYRLLNDMTTSLQQTILIDFANDPIWAGDGHSVRPYGNFVVDTDNNKLYAYVMIDSLNVTRFFKFDLPSLSDGAIVRLTTADIEEYFDIDWMYYMQGVCYYNGKIYATCGFSVSDCKLYVVDLTSKKATSVVPMGGFVGEPESAIVYDDTLYVSSTSKFFKLQF